MSFQDELKSICDSSDRFLSAVIMNLDGLVVARHDARDVEVDIEVLLVELTASLKQALQALDGVEVGELSEFSLDFAKGSLVVRPLKDEHFVALLMAPGALTGKGRHALRIHKQPLVKELF